MASLIALLFRNPLQSFLFFYNFSVLILLFLLRRVLLPHFPAYQTFRTQVQRAFLSATSTAFPDLARRLPVGKLPESRARKVQCDCDTYLIPGEQTLSSFVPVSKNAKKQAVVLYAHGGGYARGEARMYVDYMERWVQVAKSVDIDIVFLSVEYRELLPITRASLHAYSTCQRFQPRVRTRRSLTRSSPPTGCF